MEYILPQFKCLRCGHEWHIRKQQRPRICPKCKSPNWDILKETIREEVKMLETVKVPDHIRIWKSTVNFEEADIKIGDELTIDLLRASIPGNIVLCMENKEFIIKRYSENWPTGCSIVGVIDARSRFMKL
jgi:hypothetical protein